MMWWCVYNLFSKDGFNIHKLTGLPKHDSKKHRRDVTDHYHLDTSHDVCDESSFSFSKMPRSKAGDYFYKKQIMLSH